jgi:hypothetical protein
MTILITSLLTLIEQFLPLLGASSANVTLIDTIITALTNALPFVIQEAEALVPPIKNIIEALSANPATTASQLAQLQALDASVDTAFDAAAGPTDAGT